MYLFGASGHGKVIADIAAANDIKIKAFIDQDVTKKECYGFPVLNTLPDDKEKLIISIGNNLTRKKIAEQIKSEMGTLVHPKSIISGSVKIEEGTVIMGGVVINADTTIGKHCIINTNASVDHDCVVEDFVHISPNSALAGGVEVGEGSQVGIGASVIQGIKIGKWCVIGAGAVIINDIPDYSVVVGNPGRIIKKNII
ncbi:acetyltransferase [Chryseobacterium indologenes]|uniref:acetyltransferase n=1 Tax=Chryseobacterium indologenes TaxID=253 RepID=UPI0009A17086|nr:acetyltransferase [Chryseobacterium indologenes]